MKLESHYGKVDFDLEPFLYSSSVCRLENIGLANLPRRFDRRSSPENRLNHSIGVYHLASQVKADGYDLKLLKISALLHDIGIPCFGHIGERIMEESLGIDHEQLGAELIMETELGELISDQGVEKKEIQNIFLKRHSLYPLIFGSMDLDNLDNIWLYWSSTGNQPHHDPVEIASKFSVSGGNVFFSGNSRDIELWRRTRYDVYDSIVNPERKTGEAMLMYALKTCAEGNPEIFSMHNGEALEVMLENKISRKVIEDLDENRILKPEFFGVLPVSNREKIQKQYEEDYPGCFVKIDLFKFDKDVNLQTPDGFDTLSPRRREDQFIICVYKPN